MEKLDEGGALKAAMRRAGKVKLQWEFLIEYATVIGFVLSVRFCAFFATFFSSDNT